MFRKRTLQERFWEILPGLQFWTVFFGAIILSFYAPVWAALFIICFDLYWVLKALNVAAHLIAAYRKFKFAVTINWRTYSLKLTNFKNSTEFLETELRAEKNSTARTFYKEELKKFKALIASGLHRRSINGLLPVNFNPFY